MVDRGPLADSLCDDLVGLFVCIGVDDQASEYDEHLLLARVPGHTDWVSYTTTGAGDSFVYRVPRQIHVHIL